MYIHKKYIDCISLPNNAFHDLTVFPKRIMWFAIVNVRGKGIPKCYGVEWKGMTVTITSFRRESKYTSSTATDKKISPVAVIFQFEEYNRIIN